jgi:hypothetical protein
VVANFTDVCVAEHGHEGQFRLNLLERIQLPTLPGLFGAMPAGVDFVLMGAGTPRQNPAVLDSLSRLEPARLRIDVPDAEPYEAFFSEFDPRDCAPSSIQVLHRPIFLAIVSSAVLAGILVRKCAARVEQGLDRSRERSSGSISSVPRTSLMWARTHATIMCRVQNIAAQCPGSKVQPGIREWHPVFNWSAGRSPRSHTKGGSYSSAEFRSGGLWVARLF